MPGFVVDGTSGNESFISKMSEGGARASLFSANISLTGLGDASKTGESVAFDFLCKGIQIPSNTIGITTVNYMGRAVKLPGNRTYEDLSTTVINDEGYAFRNQVESWMSKINSHKGNVRASSHVSKLSGYTTSLALKTYTKGGAQDGSTWIFFNTFPTSLDQIDVNWEPNDAVMEYTINWAYDYWIYGSSPGTPETSDDSAS